VDVAARYHDVGKLGIEEAALCKPGKLNSEEWKAVKRHPVLSAEYIEKYFSLLNGFSDLSAVEAKAVCAAALHHHERWDGMGYPAGLKKEEIPLAARIIAVADAYDAMTADRPYRKAMPREEAIRRIAEGAGGQFDPEVAARFLKVVEGDGGARTRKFAVEMSGRGK
jgi:HD-GYP domain-containing protein (c-di-GMP phosphodiesterase class II)